MKRLLKLSFLCFIIMMCSSFKVDETPLEKLLKQLAKITENYPQEKVHLHMDKPFYAIGEDIWMKAYVVTAEKNEPSLLSAVLYVDLIDGKNTIRKSEKLEVVNGLANGNITLTDSLKSGDYRIRAYTNYMRNYDHTFFFEKKLTIGDVTEKATLAQNKEDKEEFTLQFFPEGGNMLEGIRGKVGVKAVNSNGLGANLSGYIENSRKEHVATFSTEHAGMGAFALLPQQGEKYTAIVKLTNGTEKSFRLPEATASGFALAVYVNNQDLQVRVNATKDKIGEREMFVVAQANGVTYASFPFKPNQAVSNATIPINNFPMGIVQFTLFNAQGQPVSERLAFPNHQQQLRIDINPMAQAFTKNKSTFELKAVDAAGNTAEGNFSVAVTDMGMVGYDEDEQVTIMSNLLLSSDLKGYIEKPNYYFNGANPDRERHLDHLLLTQGWRRFVWQDIATGKEPEITFRPELSLEISGKITGEYGKAQPNARIDLISITPGFFLKLDTVSDARGNFVFDRLALPDSAKLMVQARLKKDFKGINVVMPKSPKVAESPYFGNSIDISTYLEETKTRFEELEKQNRLGKGILLKTVTVTKQRALVPTLNVKNSANASGSVDYVIKKEQLQREMTIYSAFYKAPGVKVEGSKIYRNRAKGSLMIKPAPMLLILDGTPINQDDMPEILSTINPKDVEGIEILTNDYNLSVLGSPPGAIYITTKRGGDPPPPATNTAKIANAGYSIKKEFYMPNYDDPKVDRKMPDLRSTVYWNPNVVANTNGLGTFNFFNAGTASNYRVTIEGMDSFGNIGRKVYTYEVKEKDVVQ